MSGIGHAILTEVCTAPSLAEGVKALKDEDLVHLIKELDAADAFEVGEQVWAAATTEAARRFIHKTISQ